MSEATQAVVQAERNSYAVALSEELVFLEAILGHEELPPETVLALVERRDIIREALTLASSASAGDSAEEGIPLPGVDPAFYASVPDNSEPDEPEDAVMVEVQDDDHEFVSDRAGNCQVCGQPQDECELEP